MDGHGGHDHRTFHWSKVLWLTAVDYFSTIGYQPGIALLAVGAIAPFATIVLMLVTLFGALPVYREVARRSYSGQGSISMMENLLKGWKKLLVVLLLIGFAMTDFSITKTLSAADAAKHVVENPLYQHFISNHWGVQLHIDSTASAVAKHAVEHQLYLHQMGWTLGLLGALTIVFLMGFREAIGVGMLVGLPYTFLNLFLGIFCLKIAWNQPDLIIKWKDSLKALGPSDMTPAIALGLIILKQSLAGFPKLALGMSGFETGVSVMPQITGGQEEDQRKCRPHNRIQNTHRLLFTAAAVMGVLLLITSFSSVILVPKEAYQNGGEANGRVMAWLAHKYLGHTFGTVYDISTIAILWFAGASAMAGILNLVPRYLPRLGLAPQFVVYARPLVLLLFVIDSTITVIFKADVDAQAGAYATGVLALMLSASAAVATILYKEKEDKETAFFLEISTFAQNVLALAHNVREQYKNKNLKKTAYIVAVSRLLFRTFIQNVLALAQWSSKLYRSCKRHKAAIYFGIVSQVFLYTFIQNVRERPDGIVISSVFIAGILAVGAITRFWRSTEFRIEGVRFVDEDGGETSKELWNSLHIKGLPMVTFVDNQDLPQKIKDYRNRYSQGELVAVHVTRHQDPTGFSAKIKVRVTYDESHRAYLVVVEQAATIANTLAFVACELHASLMMLGGSHESSLTLFMRKHLTGDGDIADMVRRLLKKRRRHPEHGKEHIPAIDVYTPGKPADDMAHDHVAMEDGRTSDEFFATGDESSEEDTGIAKAA